MEFVGGALKALIDNLMPDGNVPWVNRDWVSEELQPLLGALNQKATSNLQRITDNEAAHNQSLIMIMVITAVLVLLILMVVFCYRSQRSLTGRITDGIHKIYASMGQKATNEQPPFAL